MSIQTALDALKFERAKLDQAIQLLESPTPGRRTKANDMPIALSITRRKGRKYTAAQKKAQSIATKARWAARKKLEAKAAAKA